MSNTSYYEDKYAEGLKNFKSGRRIFYVDTNHKIYRMGSTRIKNYIPDNPDEHSPWDVGITIVFKNGCESHLPYRNLDRTSLLLEERRGKYRYFDGYFKKEDAIKWFENFSIHLIKHHKTKFGQWLVKLSIKLSKKYI